MATEELESQLIHTMLDSEHKIGFRIYRNNKTTVIILRRKYIPSTRLAHFDFFYLPSNFKSFSITVKSYKIHIK